MSILALTILILITKTKCEGVGNFINEIRFHKN